MGTRNLTMVISNGETKVAQYGQWDGYPSGQGKTVVNFIKKNSVKKFKEVLEKVKWINKRKQKEIDDFFKSIGCTNGWMNMDQSKLYHEKYPLLTRDNGAQILQMIMDCKDRTIWLHDSTDFASDSLSCEWAYVLDLDKRVLEVYRGFQTTPISEDERFASMEKMDYKMDGYDYYPIHLLTKYTFGELKRMTIEEFVEKTEKLAYPEEKEINN